MLAIKRYLLPGLVAVCAYLLATVVFTPIEGRFLTGILFSILIAYFVRFCDDISDFKRDRRSGKALLGKKVLIITAAMILLILLISSLLLSQYWAMLPPAVVCAQFFFKEKYRDFIKLLFLPCILTVIFNLFFVYSYPLLILTVVCTIVDAIIILRKRCSDDSD